MGKIQAGILSPVSGKVAGVVGGRWKNKAYLRAYTIPANPNTAGQQVQRNKFKECVNFAKLLTGQVFNPYTDKFQKTMSGFNFFVKRNIAIFVGTPNWEELKLTEGVLSPVLPTSLLLTGTTVDVEWTKNNGNNGLDTDQVTLVVWDDQNNLIYFSSATEDRVSETLSLQVAAGTSQNKLTAWIFAAQTVASVLKSISNSTSIEGT